MKTTVPIDHNLSVNEAMMITGVCKTALYELLKKPWENFPRPFKIGRRTFFSATEVAQWLADRPRIAAPVTSSPEVRHQAHQLKG